MRALLRRPVTWVALVVVVAGGAVALAWFEPWRAFTSSHLDEPAPGVAAVLSEGGFRTQEHETLGTAKLLELDDGSHAVRLESFTTSDGPDVHVRLSNGDGGHVALGELKATEGNHNYRVPDDADLAGVTTVVIWCERFGVAFGSAQLLG